MKHLKGIVRSFFSIPELAGEAFLVWLTYTALLSIGFLDYAALAISIASGVILRLICASVNYANSICLDYEKSKSPILRVRQKASCEKYRSNTVSTLIKILEAEETENRAKKLLETTKQTYPWLAHQVADLYFMYDSKIADELRYKKHPATKSANKVDEIKHEKRLLQVKCKEQEYQLAYYETVFPWLEEFKQLPPAVGAQYALASDIKESSEYDTLKDWLSPEEYAALSNADKYQLALDRYKKRRKSDWEVGIEYERFVGYQYETAGYKVRYHGALMGKQDMGRDLILSKDGQYFVVQCKRWASDKEIHEKHIFQLYGSAVQLTVESGSEYIPIFITTAKLSDVARKCADYLSVRVCESYAYKDFPMIKCNISSSGEKIYHLPFDQQYDRVRIILSNGERYANTVADAERLGFRRAYRWHPSESAKSKS